MPHKTFMGKKALHIMDTAFMQMELEQESDELCALYYRYISYLQQNTFVFLTKCMMLNKKHVFPGSLKILSISPPL